MKSILSMALAAVLLFANAHAEENGKGNGGQFTVQDIYLAIDEIASDLIDLKPTYAFGIDGKEVRAELDAKHILVIVTRAPVYDRRHRLRDAINFAPGEIGSIERDRYDELRNSGTAYRVIVANEEKWNARIASGATIKNLVAHELWGAMGNKDEDYRQSTHYLSTLQRLARDPMSYICEAFCHPRYGMPGAKPRHWLNTYGSSKKEAFNNLLAACPANLGRIGSSLDQPFESANQICKVR